MRETKKEKRIIIYNCVDKEPKKLKKSYEYSLLQHRSIDLFLYGISYHFNSTFISSFIIYQFNGDQFFYYLPIFFGDSM